MAWLRLGDDVADHPIVLAPLDLPEADERTVDELFGFMVRLWTRAAKHPHANLYVVPFSTAVAQAWGNPQRARKLLDQATFAGYGYLEVDEETGRQRFRFVDDAKFIHMKTGEEIEFEAQRRTDNAKPEITVLIRLRDGDACRYCGDVVSWSDRRGAKGGTYDHRPPGMPASAETSVVACKSCNSARGAFGQTTGLVGHELLAAVDEYMPLLPAPAPPYYKTATYEVFERQSVLLRQHGLSAPTKPRGARSLPAGSRAPGSARPTSTPATPAPAAQSATTAPAHDGERPSDSDTAHTARPDGAATAPDVERPVTAAAEPRGSDGPGSGSRSPADRRYSGSGSAGSGRVGSGQVGPGTDGSQRAAGAPRRKRGRRGGRRGGGSRG